MVDGLRAGAGAPPTFEGVLAEHAAYVAALETAGVAVEILEPLDGFPDAIFVEDPALVFAEGAILLRPGAATRAGEVAALAPVLRRRFATVLDVTEGHADGGDVLTTPDRVLIGLSARTDRAGAEALLQRLATLGRAGAIVETRRPACCTSSRTARCSTTAPCSRPRAWPRPACSTASTW